MGSQPCDKCEGTGFANITEFIKGVEKLSNDKASYEEWAEHSKTRKFCDCKMGWVQRVTDKQIYKKYIERLAEKLPFE